MKSGWAFLALFLSAAARGEAVDPNAPAPDDPLQGKQIHISVPGGLEQGFDGDTTMKIGNITIDVQAPGTKPAPKAPTPVDRTYDIVIVVGALSLIGASVALRRRNAAPAAAGTPNLGETPFTIIRAIGEGGMGTVYEALDRNLDRKVAVKRLHGNSEDPTIQERFLKEAKTVAALHHPNIVDIYAVVSQGGETYMVFELIEGRTVEELLAERRRLSLADSRAILDPVCRALEFAHGHGIVHRDLKPANVMMTTLGQVKVMDFGIARAMMADDVGAQPSDQPADYRTTRTLWGTAAYLSPEGTMGVIRPEADVYALGVMLYRMIGGDYPFPAPASLEQKLNRAYPALAQKIPGAPAALDQLVNDALEPDPEKRLRTPKEFRERLAEI